MTQHRGLVPPWCMTGLNALTGQWMLPLLVVHVYTGSAYIMCCNECHLFSVNGVEATRASRVVSKCNQPTGGTSQHIGQDFSGIIIRSASGCEAKPRT